MAEHTWVCCGSAGAWGWRETRAAPLPRQTHRHPEPKGGQPATKVAEAALDTDLLRPRRAWGPPLPSPPDPLHVTPPGAGAAPQAALWPTAPLLTLRAGGTEAAAAPPAQHPGGRQLAPFVSAGLCPRRLPPLAQPRTPLPQVPPNSVRGGGQESPKARSPKAGSPAPESPKGGGSAGRSGRQGMRGGRDSGRREEERSEGAGKQSPLCK